MGFTERKLRKENEMLKKSIMVLAVLALAMPAFAGDAKMKVHVGEWPCVFEWKEACEDIKVVMHVGYYVKIKDCDKKKIKLEQKAIDKYEGCVEISIECNFEMEIKAEVHPTAAGDALSSKWSAWIDGDTVVPPTLGGSAEKRDVCVKVEKCNIVKEDPNKELTVAYVTILVRPTAQPCGVACP